ncbi:MAG: hypothetical protein ITG00_04220 [Flavobacterium sp.]|nr:hypothetical protein [Flavobacterium sp.]
MDTNKDRQSEKQQQENNQNAQRENKSPAFDSQHSGDANGGMDPGAIPDSDERNQPKQ